jgi:hypothetical protein
MIKHLVMWNLLAEDEAGKAAAAAEIKAALEGLVGRIPEILTLSVSRNAADVDRNYDLGLYSEFASVDDLNVYLVHPLHREAVAIVTSRCSSRAAIDLEA